MLHPVLPPAPPPILGSLQAANPFPAEGDTKLHSVVEADAGTHLKAEKSPQQEETPQIATSGHQENSALPTALNLTQDESAVAKTLSKPNQPESFPPEFSPLTAVKSAAALGEPLAIGFPLKPVEASASKNKSLSQKQTQSVAEFTKENKPSNALTQKSENSADFKPTKIEIPSDRQTNESPTPSTIEFTPSSQTTQTNPNQPSTNRPGFTITQPISQPTGTTPPPGTPQQVRVVEVNSDRQEYDQRRRVITAEGNVVVRFDGAVVDADRLQVSLDNLIAVGEGNIALTRGDQVLRGQRFTYNFIQDNGNLQNGSGEIFIPSASTDFAFSGTDTVGGVQRRPPSDRIRANQPLTGVSSPGSLDVTVGGRADARNITPPKQGGEVRRIRFEAAQIDFYPRGYQARNVRLTNDPFSPPELELRANKVTVTRESPLRDRINTQGQRLVLDQRTTLPIPLNQRTIDRRERDVTPAIASIGFDGDKRGGVFIERGFEPISTDSTRLRVTPQFYAQKAIQGNAANVAALFGLKARLDTRLSPQTIVEGAANLDSLDLSTVEDNLRASLRLRQQLGNTNPHILNLEYSYRDRLYNGTLGYQTVQSSLGSVITSPIIPLGKSGFNLRYQGGAQYINANTDRQDLLEPKRENDRISLGRVQGSATVDGGLLLWQGKALPPTPTEGLKYTPNSVVPYVRATAGVTGTSSYYTNGDNQSTLIGTVGLEGQFGHLSRPFLDYTAFKVSYSQGLNSGLSPFLFDRSVDNRVLNAAIVQQIYGPFRFGFETSINLDTGERSSTDYIVEYSRRTYGITLRYNPVLELGGISFRISDFNWSGGTDPFSDRTEIKPVRGGLIQE
ncbi:MAG: DUF3769 domain-containing protein [Heteroscytonema crispum UTEX LB 1556]